MRRGLLANLTLKWRVLLAYWAVHAVVAYVLAAAWLAMSGEVDASTGDFLGLRGLRDIGDVLVEPEFAGFMAMCMGGFMVLQVLALLPLRAPSKSNRGWPVAISVAVFGLVVAGLTTTLVAGVYAVADEYRIDRELTGALWEWWVLFTVLGSHWLVVTPLLWVYSRRLSRDSAVRRLSRVVFAGSIIELALLIPLDVMVRRKTECYCWSPSMYGLVFTAAIATFAFGPVAWLPLAAKRRSRFDRTHCSSCGYDMTSTLDADRCPECGARWLAIRTKSDQVSASGDAVKPGPSKSQ
ncbi:MAG: hypothetical protein AAF747_01910 [Planctomycetota bacterium]